MSKQTKKWITASGLEIPANRVTVYEKKKEKAIDAIVAEAERLNKQIIEFKKKLLKEGKELFDLRAEEESIDLEKRKGNFVLSNFDKSCKVEVTINERVVFQDEELIIAKQKLDNFLNSKLSTSAQFVKNLVMDAFQTTRGRIDTRKVLGLLSYRQRIPDIEFQEACDLIEKAQDRQNSKTYARIAKKDEHGEYKYIDLNFASVEVE